jgi:hypothetical protein
MTSEASNARKECGWLYIKRLAVNVVGSAGVQPRSRVEHTVSWTELQPAGDGWPRWIPWLHKTSWPKSFPYTEESKGQLELKTKALRPKLNSHRCFVHRLHINKIPNM